MNLDIDTFTLIFDCISFHMRALMFPKLFRYKVDVSVL